VRFTIEVLPEGERVPVDVKFSQKFYQQ
jgi:hypothetical protein